MQSMTDTPGSEQPLLREFRDGVLTLTMNRPGRRNALTPQMCELMCDALQSVHADKAVRVVVLTGAGTAFCSGGDVKAMAEASGPSDPVQLTQALRGRMEVARLLHTIPVPTIARVRGAAAGAGLSLALACDLRVASDNAKFTTAFAKVGLSGDYGGSYFLTQLVGTAKARELYLLSPVLGAPEALGLGLLNRVVADDQLDAAVAEMAGALANGASGALSRMKENLNIALQGDIERSFEAEARHHIECTFTADHKEAAAAFVDKRTPEFGAR